MNALEIFENLAETAIFYNEEASLKMEKKGIFSTYLNKDSLLLRQELSKKNIFADTVKIIGL